MTELGRVLTAERIAGSRFAKFRHHAPPSTVITLRQVPSSRFAKYRHHEERSDVVIST